MGEDALGLKRHHKIYLQKNFKLCPESQTGSISLLAGTFEP